MALGATVVIGANGENILRQIFVRHSTIVPDALSQSQMAPAIESVSAGSPFQIADSERPVMVVAITSSHASDTVFTYVGGGNVVFMGDGSQQVPELRAAIEALGLNVTTYAVGHGQAVPYE